MWVCCGCLEALGPGKPAACPSCGTAGAARVRGAGEITRFSAETGILCDRCGEAGHDLRFAAFRRVIGLLIVDRLIFVGGYFCRGCRWRLYVQFQALTLMFGWWGVLAMLFRNPYSLLANTVALIRPPILPGVHGAIAFTDLQAAVHRSMEEASRRYEVRSLN